jgi:hypothetical protein
MICPHRSDAVHFPEAVRLSLDDVERLLAEGSQQLLGADRPDAPDHARSQVLLDTVERCWGRGFEEPGLELLTVSAVISPVTSGRDPLTSGNHGGVANDRDEVAATARLYPDHAESVLGVLIGDALDQPSKHLSVGWLWVRLDDAHRTDLVAKALARGSMGGRSMSGFGSLKPWEGRAQAELKKRAVSLGRL